jgi:hypothetical protein
MTSRIVLSICIALHCGFCVPAYSAQVKECTDGQQKEIILAHPKNWEDFYGIFKRLSHCDDGAMAENFSDIVVRLLARDWKHFGVLETRVASDRNFGRFVLRHIDATTNPDDLRLIIDNSRQHCASSSQKLCKSLEAEAKSALKEQGAFKH